MCKFSSPKIEREKKITSQTNLVKIVLPYASADEYTFQTIFNLNISEGGASKSVKPCIKKEEEKSHMCSKKRKKIPAYERHWISWPMRISVY